MGFDEKFKKGVFIQTVLAVNELFIGYYGWRSGTLTELTFPNGNTLRIAPDLNAGTVAIQYFFSNFYNQAEWQRVIDPNTGFPAFYAEQFGDPWERAQNAGPIFPPGLTVPTMVLPFEPNREWSYTGGPHGAWEHDGPLAAIDFAPATDKPGCTESKKWLVAAAPGLVVRSDNGVVVLDLDGDGYEETGWNLLYLHVGTKDRVKLNAWVEADERIGHASCEGGVSTGTHLHLARKYNGEWVLADGPLPFILSGYVVHNGAVPYEGTLTKGDKTIIAHPAGTASTVIYRQPYE
jgi:murein DD-endopeptidase MepM/ murein hydrolase activator NlpD